jgi:hypothetical protein
MTPILFLVLARMFAQPIEIEGDPYTRFYMPVKQKQPWKRGAAFCRVKVHRRKVCK